MRERESEIAKAEADGDAEAGDERGGDGGASEEAM